MARAGFYLFAAGGTIGVVSVLLPGGPGRNEEALLVTSFAAYACAVFELVRFDRLSLRAFEVLTALGTVLVSSALYFGGAGSDFYRLFYVWVVLYAAYFFPWRRVAVQVVLVAIAYALVLALAGPARLAPLAWFVTTATLAVAAALVIVLRGRLQALLAVERVQVERLRELDRLKDEFMATVSHELRTPLAAVYGAAVTLHAHRLDEAQQRAMLETIHDQSERLAALVDDILLATRLEGGPLAPAIERCDVTPLALEVVQAARAHAPDHVSLDLVADCALPPVAADPNKLRQVLANLVENAVKYSPAGGRIEVRLEPENGHLRLSVRDEGLGIPAHEQERIFEKFYRLDPNLTQGVGGTGLGLYISRQLIERMHGRLSVASALGEGSTFAVELPLAAGTQ